MKKMALLICSMLFGISSIAIAQNKLTPQFQGAVKLVTIENASTVYDWFAATTDVKITTAALLSLNGMKSDGLSVDEIIKDQETVFAITKLMMDCINEKGKIVAEYKLLLDVAAVCYSTIKMDLFLFMS